MTDATRSVEIPRTAVRQAVDVYESARADGCSSSSSMTAALAAALPYLAPAAAVEVCYNDGPPHPRTECHMDRCGLDPAAPAGDGGLREALEAVLDQHECTQPDTPKFNRAVLDDLLAAVAAHSTEPDHPAAPAVPQPVDREALRKLMRDALDAYVNLGPQGYYVYVDSIAALLAGEQEQVEK